MQLQQYLFSFPVAIQCCENYRSYVINRIEKCASVCAKNYYGYFIPLFNYMELEDEPDMKLNLCVYTMGHPFKSKCNWEFTLCCMSKSFSFDFITFRHKLCKSSHLHYIL